MLEGCGGGGREGRGVRGGRGEGEEGKRKDGWRVGELSKVGIEGRLVE